MLVEQVQIRWDMNYRIKNRNPAFFRQCDLLFKRTLGRVKLGVGDFDYNIT